LAFHAATSDNSPLNGRTAIVTGGSRGIGRAISRALASDGASVVVNYERDAAAAAALVTELKSAGHSAFAFQGSVAIEAHMAAMVEEVSDRFAPADIVINCAGVAGSSRSVVDTHPDELQHLMAVHAFGPHGLARLTVPGMRARGGGDVAMISSTAARTLGANHAAYNMAKAAMEALALTLAAEEARYGVRVNVVAPGLVDTAMGRLVTRRDFDCDIAELAPASPMGRLCSPEDVAAVVAFVVGPHAQYVNGQRIAVDGGASRGLSLGD
jgi:3-oxoacyl-[acyl-carrier protein] reductase